MNVFDKGNALLLQKIRQQHKLKRYLQFIFGMFLMSLSFNLFLSPNGLVTGGVSGIAIMLNYLFNIPNAVVLYTGMVILIILSYLFLGKERTKANVLGSILFPTLVMITQFVPGVLQIDTTNLLLTSIFAGLMTGFGLGLVIKAGFASGGTDILQLIISKYFHMSMGKAIILIDGTILLSAVFIFGINNVMYAMIILYLISYISDKVILGISENKAFYIITKEEEKVKDYILKALGHGITEFNATGGYLNEKQKVIMSVLPTKEYFTLKEGLKAIDKDAFFIITDAYEVFGGENAKEQG